MKKILVVDDEPDIVRILKHLLEKNNYTVITAPDGEFGVRLAIEERPDLILMDILMPVKDGIEAFGEISKNPATSQIPVIFLTAMISSKEESVLKSRLGGSPYLHVLAKPFDVPLMLKTIEELTSKS